MIYPFRSDQQVERYIAQFMRVFSGFQVRDGVERNGERKLERVPIVYGNMSRIVASVLQKRGTFQNNRIPIMAANLRALELDPQRKKSHHHVDSVVMNGKGTDRIIGPALNLQMELSLYCSSTEQLFQLLEQILLNFNPRVTIQVDNNVLNSDFITEIELLSIDPEIQYPMGTEQQLVMLTLQFNVPVRLRYPMDMDGPLIKEIHLNIFQESQKGIEHILLENVIITGGDSEELDDGNDEHNEEENP